MVGLGYFRVFGEIEGWWWRTGFLIDRLRSLFELIFLLYVWVIEIQSKIIQNDTYESKHRNISQMLEESWVYYRRERESFE